VHGVRHALPSTVNGKPLGALSNVIPLNGSKIAVNWIPVSACAALT
jgi:hypothetical protein